jgi:AcrR family transcriptional regulator
MANKARSAQRREDSLTREGIIAVAIELLDASGEDGLTFRALSERLATGAGAIYWHVANKGDLMTAACDAIVARAMLESVARATPEDTIRATALAMFDAMDAHPWIGLAQTHAPGQSPMVRLLERLGQQVQALNVPHEEQWATVSALLSYILGVGAQNAANGQIARVQDLNRSKLLDAVATAWSQFDADEFPFTRSIAGQLRVHDDRADFIAGVELILRGIGSSPRRRGNKPM